jgi:hypothetical protein
MPHNKEETPRQPYEKPKLRRIELAADEVLSVGCKTANFDPNGVAGNGCGPASPCSSIKGS